MGEKTTKEIKEELREEMRGELTKEITEKLKKQLYSKKLEDDKHRDYVNAEIEFANHKARPREHRTSLYMRMMV